MIGVPLGTPPFARLFARQVVVPFVASPAASSAARLLSGPCSGSGRGAVRLGSSKRWLDRQARDPYTRRAKELDYRSRAAFKLDELQHKFRFFRPGQTVVDLGYAPGSWSQVAMENVGARGHVVGVDLIPMQPPEGVSAIQGDFLDPFVQEQLRLLLRKYSREQSVAEVGADVVLSDMCGIDAPENPFVNSINTPYRLANSSGIAVRDHATSVELCDAALMFCDKNLKRGGTFVCKIYTGEDDKVLEKRIRRKFKEVRRVKPGASRSESREVYFVALKKKAVASGGDIAELAPGESMLVEKDEAS